MSDAAPNPKGEDNAGPDNKSSTDRYARSTAIIGAVFGLLGTIVGAGVSYFATAQQLDRQDSAKATDARKAACVASLRSMERNRSALTELDAAVTIPDDPSVATKAQNMEAASADFRDTIPSLYLDGTPEEVATVQKFIDLSGIAETELLKAAQPDTSAKEKSSLIVLAEAGVPDLEKAQQQFAAQCRTSANR